MLTQDSSKRADLGSGRTVELRDGGRETGAGDSELCELPLGPYKGHRGLRQGPLHLHRVHPEETRRRERGAIQTSGELLVCFTSLRNNLSLYRWRRGATTTLDCTRPRASCKCSS